ncbi:hypothetical protein AMATHDRAFT_192042 [Amanita thiersii Skay4041]|uniref:AB hydrolase-1 domain-containing protein n=1 Tax=Amanita thiersii Skay4041 TaxID=703135 RepID=A0A2A9NLM5_9AGAR|nr:hypothetical protein AMATHDRAFT_192042 [Amanita thiersii Skay4041]
MVNESQQNIDYYHHGRFSVRGGVLPDAITAFKTYGNPKNPCIVFPTCYGGKLSSKNYAYTSFDPSFHPEIQLGIKSALDPTRYFIVTFALFSNGESSSPSNTPQPYNGPYFPAISYEDNINAQYVVLTKHLGIKKLRMVIGFSMGGQQAYHWAAMYPEFLEKYVVICGSARTSVHNQCFLEGPKAALMASKDFGNGHYTSTPQIGLRAFGRAYSAWAYGQTWFRENQHLYNGTYPDLNAFLHEQWELGFLLAWDANDLLTLLNTWQTGDVTKVKGSLSPGNLQACLSGIVPQGLIMPCKTDLYFPPEDNELEMQYLGGNAKLVVIDSVWGHMAGGASNERDIQFMNEQIKQFLAE